MIIDVAGASVSTAFQDNGWSARSVLSHQPGLKIPSLELHCQAEQKRILPTTPISKNSLTSNSAPGISSDQAYVERLARELKEITTLYNLSVTVGSSLNLDQVIWLLYKESSRLLDTSNFAIIIYEAETGTLNFALMVEQGRRCQSFSLKSGDNLGPLGRVLTGQMPLLIDDLLQEEVPGVGSGPPKQPVRSWLGVPIFSPMLPDQGIQGAIVTWSYNPKAFSEHELWLLSAIGTQAATAIRNARLYEAVLAERDRVIEAQQEARQVLARDLHDGPTQLVSAISMGLDFCQRLLEKEPARLDKEVEALQELARQAIHQMRTLLFELRPLVLETQGLQSAVQLFLERRQKEVAERTKLSLEVRTDSAKGEISRQETKVEAALFAIIQETVNNAIKHAQANQIVVQLIETATELYATIIDDGVGFNVARVQSGYEQQGSLGMVNIHERAELIGGELKLSSQPGQGTRITLQVSRVQAERLKKRGATGPLQLRRKDKSS